MPRYCQLHFSSSKSTHLFPPGNLLFTPYTRYVFVSTRALCDKSGLCDQESTRNASSLRIVFCSIRSRDVGDCTAKTSEWCEDHAMGELELAYLDRFEESGCERRHESEKSLKLSL